MKHGMPSAFVLLSVAVGAAAHAQTSPGYRHMWGDWGWGHMIFGSLMMVLFWGGIVVAVVLLFRWLGGGSTGQVPRLRLGRPRSISLEIVSLAAKPTRTSLRNGSACCLTALTRLGVNG